MYCFYSDLTENVQLFLCFCQIVAMEVIELEVALSSLDIHMGRVQMLSCQMILLFVLLGDFGLLPQSGRYILLFLGTLCLLFVDLGKHFGLSRMLQYFFNCIPFVW